MADLVGITAVEGLADLRYTLRRLDKDLAKGLTVGIKKAASIVAEEAKSNAPHKTGLLENKIRPRVKGDIGIVASLAKRKSAKYPTGYAYGKKIEYMDGGKRAYLHPALKAKQPEVIKQMEKLLDELEDHWKQ